MTHNQIDFQNLKESQRHNLEMERQGRDVLSESSRHNQAIELETNRSNLINESIKRGSLSETIRSNQAKENLQHESNILNYNVGMYNARENARHNLASESETTAHNRISEMEVNRSNTAKEDETSRHNLAVETEDQRHAMVSEQQTVARDLLNYSIGSQNAMANTINANVNRYLAPSQKWRNIGNAANDITGAFHNNVKMVSDLVGIIPKAIGVSRLLIPTGGR